MFSLDNEHTHSRLDLYFCCVQQQRTREREVEICALPFLFIYFILFYFWKRRRKDTPFSVPLFFAEERVGSIKVGSISVVYGQYHEMENLKTHDSLYCISKYEMISLLFLAVFNPGTGGGLIPGFFFLVLFGKGKGLFFPLFLRRERVLKCPFLGVSGQISRLLASYFFSGSGKGLGFDSSLVNSKL